MHKKLKKSKGGAGQDDVNFCFEGGGGLSNNDGP